ncbi:hypothetical protein ACW9H6_11840 [Pseudomonas sp. SDO528_S397]
MPVGSDGTLYLPEIEINATNDPFPIGGDGIRWGSSSAGTKIHEEIKNIKAQDAYSNNLLSEVDKLIS